MNFKEALIAHLQGQKVQCMGCEGTWKPLMEKIGEGLIRYVDTQSYMSGLSFRIAPRTILVNGVEVPAPETVAPAYGSGYYTPHVTREQGYSKDTWDGASFDLHVLEQGIVYLNKEDAIARSKAMLITQEAV